MTPIIITLGILIPSKQGRIDSGTDLGTEARFVVFIPDLLMGVGEGDINLEIYVYMYIELYFAVAALNKTDL